MVRARGVLHAGPFLVLLFLQLHNSISISLQPIHSIKSIMGQAITTSQWYIHGKRTFTKTGYLKHVKKYESLVQSRVDILRGAEGADGVDLEGNVFVITGANSGIGKEMATYAAAKGASVYMICRSKERAEKARDDIISQTSNDKVKVVLADVGELSQVRKVVEEIQSMEPKVDCLVCNAGVLLNDRQETSEGNEVTFASHLLGGSYLLPQLLVPQLKQSPKSRVVFVSSGGMMNTKFPDWATATNKFKDGAKDAVAYDGNMAYSYAKRGQVLLAEQWTKEYPEIKFVSTHPGWTSTDAVEKAYGDSKKYLEPMRNTWEGAEGITWLMTTDKKNLEGGGFYLDRKPTRKHISGAFMTEGSFTKNTPEQVDEMMAQLKKACGL